MDFRRFRFNLHFTAILPVLISLAVYVLILTNRSANIFRPVSVVVRFSFMSVLIPMVLVLTTAFAVRGWAGRLLRITLSLAIFSLALAGMWASGQSDTVILGGLLPISDASGYYLDTQRLLAGNSFTTFSSRRPLFASLFSVLLYLTGQNLTWGLAVLVLITASGCYLAARVVRQSHGPLAAALFLTVIFFFYRRYDGAVMTESLGLTLGALGFALLWSNRQNSLRRTLLGIAALTLGLIARAGPFFVIPGVLVWGYLQYESGSRVRRIFTAAALAVVALCFVFNQLLYLTLGDRKGTPFSNFAYSLYGLAMGDRGWAQIYTDHPEISSLPEGEYSAVVYSLVWDAVREDPARFMHGLLAQYGHLFSGSWFSAYGFLGGEDSTVSVYARFGMFGLAAVGLFSAVRRPKDCLNLLILLMTAGFLLSVPFVPPRDTNRMRAYMTVAPLVAVLPALGAAWLVDRVRPNNLLSAPEQEISISPILEVMFVLLLVVIAAGPFLVRGSNMEAKVSTVECSQGLSPVVVRYHPGAAINIVPEDTFVLDWLPTYHRWRFIRYVHSMPYEELVIEFEKIDPPATIFVAVDQLTNSGAWVFVNTALLPAEPERLGLCGTWRDTPDRHSNRLFDAVELGKILP